MTKRERENRARGTFQLPKLKCHRSWCDKVCREGREEEGVQLK